LKKGERGRGEKGREGEEERKEEEGLKALWPGPVSRIAGSVAVAMGKRKRDWKRDRGRGEEKGEKGRGEKRRGGKRRGDSRRCALSWPGPVSRIAGSVAVAMDKREKRERERREREERDKREIRER
jgi:hypothetical protein